ncbi:response regulator [Candidatus Bathyarchaeota archaeon]|nr:response regulator [Candidatus Bathyarchaeota archaeon]
MQTEQPSERGRHHVIIVDDDPDIRESFTQILEARGYSVDTAETGKVFLDKTKKNAYDLAIVDLKLPDMEGVELLRYMRQISPKTKKIVITGYPTLESAIDAMGSGTDAYLLKPVEPEDFLRVVEQKIRERDETEILTADETRGQAKQIYARKGHSNRQTIAHSKGDRT